jgi:hypothetical protein
LSVPDPNSHTGEVLIKRGGTKEWESIAHTHTDRSPARGIGVADLALAVLNNRPHRANGAMANHIVEIMQAFDRSSSEGRHIAIKSRCEKPAALRPGLAPGQIE